MKDLPPSQRPKKRYLRFKIHSDKSLELGDVVDSFWQSSIEFSGLKGMSKADMWIMGEEYNESENEGVVRVNREVIDDFISSLLFIEEIGGEDCFVEVLKVSGSIKKV